MCLEAGTGLRDAKRLLCVARELLKRRNGDRNERHRKVHRGSARSTRPAPQGWPQIGDPLDDVKSITQVVGYAANDGIEWCVLTSGVRYKVYKASEKARAEIRNKRSPIEEMRRFLMVMCGTP